MIDIQYLLFLQKLREMTGGVFDNFFHGITKMAVDVIYYLPFIVYWAVDKEWGKRFVAVLHGSELVNSIVKLSVCAYRPWIRSELINPAGDSKVAATGYSFPSGHANRATAIFGSIAVDQFKKRRWLSILCLVGILLTIFSRNFLGVHTPQDVLVGCLISFVVIFLAEKIQKAVEGKEKFSDILCFLGIVCVVAVILYIKLKSYPMDYDENGKLLVNPKTMMNDCFKVCGSFSALMVSLYLDRHFIHYEIPTGHKNLPILACVGTGIFFSWRNYFAKAIIIDFLGKHLGNFVAYFIGTIFAMVIFPIIIKKFTKSEEN